VVLGALVPNERGLDAALAAHVSKVSVFTAASETFNQRNVNASIADSIERFRPVAQRTKAAGLVLRGYVSAAIACPYEGWIAPPAVTEVARRLLDLGCDELSIGDTIGAGTPAHVARLLDDLLGAVPVEQVVLHFHDTRGMAVANVAEGLRHGVARYDASSGGLGGCPFAPGAAGNLATEDLLFLLDGLGIATGVDLEAQRRASGVIAPHVAGSLPSRVLHAPPLAP
jgi:hydroxymethylglutaryl-CoA lyase